MCNTGRAVENAQLSFLLQKQHCVVLERIELFSFCRNEMSKIQKNWRSQHPSFFGVMIKTYETARY
jgi:hypothetical protein